MNQPAFPIADPFAVKSPSNQADALRLQNGMTLLDYFAAKAMQAALESNHPIALQFSHADRAELAYNQAEAMMAERAKRGL
jgi:uncharacterized protein YciW